MHGCECVALCSLTLNKIVKLSNVSLYPFSSQIKRFTDEVYNDIVALSGKKFFYLTRHLVLSVGGTIITYELVLVQFKTNDDIPDYDPCRR